MYEATVDILVRNINSAYGVAVATLIFFKLPQESYGLSRYEVSNFAASEECESAHNRGYWSGGEYVGVGPGAHGRFRPRNAKDYPSAMRYEMWICRSNTSYSIRNINCWVCAGDLATSSWERTGVTLAFPRSLRRSDRPASRRWSPPPG